MYNCITFSVQNDAALQKIALSLQDSLGDGSCTRQVIGAIVALAARPSLPLLASQRSSFIKFMVGSLQKPKYTIQKVALSYTAS